MAQPEASPSVRTPAPLVAVRGLSKSFGPVKANQNIDLDVLVGENHALLGENGAGKSTLVKMLYGLLQPSAGEILWQGRPVVLDSPEAARALGIGMVFQHFSLFENLTVSENIALVLAPERQSVLDARIGGLSERYGLKLEPSRPVWSLSAGERQRIEIARVLLQDPKLMILDEPTSVLTPREAESLFAILERLKAEGRALLYISHRLDDVSRLCPRATGVGAGRVVGTCDPRVETARSMAAQMVGAQIADVTSRARAEGPERFAVCGLSLSAPGLHATALRDIDLTVRGGEVQGIAGVAGNGQDELFAALSGERLGDDAEAIRIDGRPAGRDGITARRRRGAAFVPEERNGHAAVPGFALSDNLVLSRHATGEVSQVGFLRGGAARRIARRVIQAFDVRVGAPDPAARTLSGGNLQKFVVGREILREPGLLVINQPTWGVDALAGAAIHQAILDLAARGSAVVVISQDLDELFRLCDRLCVIHDGTLSPATPTAETDRDDVGLRMAGTVVASPAHHAH